MARLPALPTWSMAGRPLLEGRAVFTPDSRHLVVHGVGDGGWLQIWDIAARKLAFEFDRHFLTGVGVGRDGVFAMTRDRFLRVQRRGRNWTVHEYPHDLPTDDPNDYGNRLWMRSMLVGAEETVLATRRWIARVSTADPSRLLGFCELHDVDACWTAMCVRRHRGRWVVSLAYDDFSGINRERFDPAAGKFKLDKRDLDAVRFRFVTLSAEGQTLSELALGHADAEFWPWSADPTATAVLPASGRRRAAVFHTPGGVAEVRPVEGGTTARLLWPSASGRAVVGVAGGRVTRWMRSGGPPTAVAVTGRQLTPSVSQDGERCVLLNHERNARPYGIAVDLDGGRVIGRCPGHPAGMTPHAFSSDGRLFASVVTDNTDSDYPDRVRSGTIIVSDLGR